MVFENRYDAGRKLARSLTKFANGTNSVVLGLPCGGVPVAYEVAKALKLPMDILLVRKLGVPGHEELAMAAIASGGVRVINEEVVRLMPDAKSAIEETTVIENKELQRREAVYRGDRTPVQLDGRGVIIVDDGLATGASMQAALKSLQQFHLNFVVVAIPVASRDAYAKLGRNDVTVVSLITPEEFQSVGQYYHDFSPTTDEEVIELMRKSAQ